MPSSDLKILLSKWTDDVATDSEQQQLFALIDGTSDIDLQNALIEILATIQPDDNEERRRRILNELLQRIYKNETKVVPMRRRWIKWIAAASIILIIGIAAVVGVLTNNHNNNKPDVTVAADVKPPTNTRAVITLANGSKVYLDSAGNGILAQQNDVDVVRNENGEIIYNRKDAKTQGGIAYNTLFNPRGSKVISLTLSDGTKVWLNSESSLRYPASFAPSAVNREVEITGEAYFEVKHNAKQPFKVHLPNGSIVEDIGTAFNINAYNDEASIKTTLIEGSVRVVGDASLNTNNGGGGVVLKPGQQAVLNQANPSILPIKVQDNVDVDQITAWKNGLFSFQSADITTVMKQLERWYDLQVVYNATIHEKFHVEMDRNTNLSNVFKILEETGGVKFKIEGKKIIVTK